MTAWTKNPLVVDISHYNTFDMSLAKGTVDLVIAKCGEMVPGWSEAAQYDKTFHVFAQAAYDNGIPFGAYIFLTPDDWIVNQKTGGLEAYKNCKRADDKEYQLYRKWIANKVMTCHAIDLEKQFINGAQANGVIPSNWIIANLDVFYRHLLEGMAAKEVPDLPVFLYSGEWYAEGYCKVGNQNVLYNWIGNHPEVYIWSAMYPTIVNPPLVTWAQVREKMTLKDTDHPPYLNSAKMPLLWQFNAGGGMKVLTDYVGAKPQYRETDISACSVSKDELHKILKIGAVEPPEPPKPPEPPVVDTELVARVTALEAKVSAQDAKIAKIETYLKAYS
jgi:hypothetical protein